MYICIYVCMYIYKYIYIVRTPSHIEGEMRSPKISKKGEISYKNGGLAQSWDSVYRGNA